MLASTRIPPPISIPGPRRIYMINNRSYIENLRMHMMAYLTYLSVIFMSDIDTEQEKLFRERYAEELRKKKQQDTYHYGGYNELELKKE